MQTTSAYQQEGMDPSRQTASQRSGLLTSTRASKALFMLAAGGSFLFSVYLWFLVDREQGLFVGLWVPSILALGALMLSGKGGRA